MTSAFLTWNTYRHFPLRCMTNNILESPMSRELRD